VVVVVVLADIPIGQVAEVHYVAVGAAAVASKLHRVSIGTELGFSLSV
jgi:hypothetical protein